MLRFHKTWWFGYRLCAWEPLLWGSLLRSPVSSSPVTKGDPNQSYSSPITTPPNEKYHMNGTFCHVQYLMFNIWCSIWTFTHWYYPSHVWCYTMLPVLRSVQPSHPHQRLRHVVAAALWRWSRGNTWSRKDRPGSGALKKLSICGSKSSFICLALCYVIVSIHMYIYIYICIYIYIYMCKRMYIQHQ